MRAITPLILILLLVTGCFKNEPRKETFKAAGSWKLEEVTIEKFSPTGSSISTETQTEAGFLMLSFGDDFMYENYYSYSLSADKLFNSKMYPLFQVASIWGITVDAKAFNLGAKDVTTGFVTYIGTFTVNQLSKKRMELQYIEIDPVTENIVLSEVWKMRSATH